MKRPPLRPVARAAPLGGVAEHHSPIHSSVELERAHERRQAVRALLMRPLLSAHGKHAAAFALVRRHAGWLCEWFARYPGWSLQVESEFGRLRKLPADLGDGTRPARGEDSEQPLSRRQYVLLCLALAALARADRQTILGRLAEDVVALRAGDPELAAAGVEFDLGSRDQRRDLVEVIKLLIDLRVLLRIQGEEAQYVSGQGDVLYTINRPVLAAVVSYRRSPVSIVADTLPERLTALVEEPSPDTEEGRNRRIRTALFRRLLDDPIVYYDTLSEEQRVYLSSQRAAILRQIEEATGLVPEVRREGLGLVDEDGDLTDLGLPEEGTDGHVTLLLAEHLASRLRQGQGGPVNRTALLAHTTALVDAHRGHWRKDATAPGAAGELLTRTLERLEALRLVRLHPEGIQPLPAIARYALAPPTPAEPGGKRRAKGRS